MDVRRQALGVLAFCFVTNMVSRGIGESFAVFLLPVAAEFGGDRALLTGIASVYMLATGAMSPLVGIAIDRFGPRACYTLGLAVFGAVYLLAGFATALWQLYLLIGMAAAVGTSLIGLVPASSLATRWFQARLPSAMGLLSAALGIGMLVFAPLAQALIGLLGWRGTYQAMGAVLLLSALPVWLMPWARIAAGAPDVSRARRAAAPADAWTIRRAVRTPAFWALTGVMFFTSLSTVTVSVQLVAGLVAAGFAPLFSATVFGVAGMASIVGMLGAGWFSERIGEKPFATISYSASILGIGALALLEAWPSMLLLAAFVLLFGTMQGSRGPLVAVLSVRHFAGARQSAIYGLVLLGMGGARRWAPGPAARCSTSPAATGRGTGCRRRPRPAGCCCSTWCRRCPVLVGPPDAPRCIGLLRRARLRSSQGRSIGRRRSPKWRSDVGVFLRTPPLCRRRRAAWGRGACSCAAEKRRVAGLRAQRASFIKFAAHV